MEKMKMKNKLGVSLGSKNGDQSEKSALLSDRLPIEVELQKLSEINEPWSTSAFKTFIHKK